MAREEITSVFPGDSRTNAVSIMYQRYAQRHVESPNMPTDAGTAYRQAMEGGTAIDFALYVLDHPGELAEAQRMADEIERKQPKL